MAIFRCRLYYYPYVYLPPSQSIESNRFLSLKRYHPRLKRPESHTFVDIRSIWQIMSQRDKMHSEAGAWKILYLLIVKNCKLGSIPQIQLFKDYADVVADSTLAQMQNLRDFPV